MFGRRPLLASILTLAALPWAAHASPGGAEEDRLIAISETIALRPTQTLSPAQRTFKIVWELEAEVNNGGFDQYFFNSSGRDAPRAVAALRTIGARKCAQIVAEAVHRFGRPDLDWADVIKRREALNTFEDDTFDDLDARFLAYPDPLSALLYKFVAAHPADF
ncbi:DMP19 family protein [Caulobacter sp. KR2-114]|uniref:DMP19 family protein n=1 Tax=Caulobacter sp. KR2-114 TaxID=3400912 RepID=UPI003C0646A5